jgi:tRNA(Ile)-lysidine synthase
VLPLAQKVLDHARRFDLLKPGDRVGIAVSGGADSVGLLRLLLELRHELGIVLSVVHFNHKLRGTESDDDERFVANLAGTYDLEFHVSSGDVAVEAEANHLSIETAAREMRYEFFRQLQEGFERAETGFDGSSRAQASQSLTSQLAPEFPQNSDPIEQNSASEPPARSTDEVFHGPIKLRRLDAVATGHTLDDQAETVLMRVLRGTGTHGLGGIHPVVALEEESTNEPNESSAKIIRPLLTIRHHELEAYLREIGQPWREDSSNRNLHHTRNRVRHLLLPLLEREFNPAVTGTLAELAEIARTEEDYWENEISGWMGTAIHWSEPEWARSHAPAGSLMQLQPHNPELQKRLLEPGPLVMNASVDLLWLLSEMPAVQRRAIKAVGDTAGFPLEFKHVEEILSFAGDENSTGKELSLPLGWKVVREPEALTFLTPDLRTRERTPADYEYPLALPGRAIVPEAGIVIEAVRVNPNQKQKEDLCDCLLDASLVSNPLRVRNWRAGDRFWPVHTKAPKKIKELLQEKHITGPERRSWPVVASGDQIIWVRGLSASTQFRAQNDNSGAVLIRAVPLEDEL